MKVQNKIFHIVSCLLVLSVFSMSCRKEFLDLEPYSDISADIAITNEADMGAALNGSYATLRSNNLFGRTIPLFGDLIADNVYISAINSNRYLDFFQVNYTVNNGNASAIWRAAYTTILRANNVINSELANTGKVEEYRAEARAIRALMYFELVKHFAKPYQVDPSGLGVPIVLTYDPKLKPARNTIAEVYAQIEDDLTKAITNLPDDNSSGFFTSYAAKALLARMYLYKHEWAKALATSQDIIDNSGYILVPAQGVVSFWSRNTPRTDKVEVLFEVVFDAVQNAGIDALDYFYDQQGYGDALAADAFYVLFTETDVRRQLFLTSSPIRGDVKVVNKYPNSSSADPDEFKVLRLSEVYLTAAEAAFQSGDETLALDYLNELVSKRDPAFAGYNSSGQALLNDILLERRKELAFEGQRYWDLARYNLAVNRVNMSANYPGNVPLTIAADNFRRILPIPQSELDANPNIRNQQNPGY